MNSRIALVATRFVAARSQSARPAPAGSYSVLFLESPQGFAARTQISGQGGAR